MIWVKAIIDPKLYLKVPGQIIKVWGHDFEIQQDGSLCMEMDEDFVASETNAGRIKKMSSPPPGKDTMIHKKITVIDTTPFTMDIGNYYGVGDLNKLIEKVTAMKKSKILEFADERFENHDLKSSMTVEDLADQMRSLIDSAFIKKDD